MVKYEDKVVVTLDINGEVHKAAVRPSDVLLDVLRQLSVLQRQNLGAKTATAEPAQL